MKITKIGNINIGNGVFLAPMEDVSDLPFRVICKRLGADIVYSEFISSEGIVRLSRKSKEKMIIDDNERPTAIQIFGANEKNMVESAKIVEDSGADILDINFGCWVKKVVQREAGAAFLKQPEKMAELTQKVVASVNIPVTVKTRLGWDPKSIVVLDVAKWIEEAGAKAFAIHCRTRDMGMTGEADWTWVKKLKEILNIPVILNGDVKTPNDVKKAFEEYDADAVMIGRACIGYPFIFYRAKIMMEQGFDPGEPDIRHKIDTCLEHLQLTIESKGPFGLVTFRKHYSGYLKGYFEASRIRKSLMEAKTFNEVNSILNDYYDFLNKEGKLEPVSKVKTITNLNCENSKFVNKQLLEN